jgi:chromate reductase
MIQIKRPRLLLLGGSLRRDSHQRRLLECLARLCESDSEIDMVQHGEIALPLFDQDLEDNPSVMREVLALHSRIELADGLVLASPEHNSQVSAFLKNTVDWVSRLPRIIPNIAPNNAFQNKPVLLTSASTGWTGGVVGLQAARLLFAYLGCVVVPGQICVSDAEQWIAGGRFAFDGPFADHIQRIVAEFVGIVGSSRSTSPGAPMPAPRLSAA